MPNTESHNPCRKERCNACCSEFVATMTQSEFLVFIAAFLQLGKQPVRLKNTDIEFAFMVGGPGRPHDGRIFYTSKYPYQKVAESGKGTNARVQVVVNGVCPNNADGECQIYENRPSCCRSFGFNSSKCRQVRSDLQQSFIPLTDLDLSEGSD